MGETFGETWEKHLEKHWRNLRETWETLHATSVLSLRLSVPQSLRHFSSLRLSVPKSLRPYVPQSPRHLFVPSVRSCCNAILKIPPRTVNSRHSVTRGVAPSSLYPGLFIFNPFRVKKAIVPSLHHFPVPVSLFQLFTLNFPLPVIYHLLIPSSPCLSVSRSLSLSVSQSFLSFLRCRQLDGNFGSVQGFTLEGNLPLHLLDNPKSNGKSQTRTLTSLFCGIKR